MGSNRYSHNETMRILGESRYLSRMSEMKPLLDIKAAYMEEMKEGRRVPVLEMMSDAYVWGIIEGKRIERARRKKGKENADAGKEV